MSQQESQVFEPNERIRFWEKESPDGMIRIVKVCTSYACPEQYEFYIEASDDPENDIVAYARLRWGNFTVECPDVGGELIYECKVGDELTGCFPSEQERMQQLQLASEKIIQWWTAHDVNIIMGE